MTEHFHPESSLKYGPVLTIDIAPYVNDPDSDSSVLLYRGEKLLSVGCIVLTPGRVPSKTMVVVPTTGENGEGENFHVDEFLSLNEAYRFALEKGQQELVETCGQKPGVVIVADFRHDIEVPRIQSVNRRNVNRRKIPNRFEAYRQLHELAEGRYDVYLLYRSMLAEEYANN